MGANLCGEGDNDAKEVMRKFRVYTVDTVRPSPLPQLVTGRVAPASRNMSSPLKANACVYYHVEAQTLNKTDGNETWTKVFEEAQCVDFVLADPGHSEECCAVHGRGSQTTIRVHSVADGSYSQQGNRLENLWDNTSSTDSPPIKALAARHKFDLNDPNNGFLGGLRTGSPKMMRYFEYSFDVNEQIVLLGIVTERMGADGKTMKFITPCTDESLSREYFKTFGWSEHSQSSWHALFKNGPAILASDDDLYFQGITVDPFDADTGQSITYTFLLCNLSSMTPYSFPTHSPTRFTYLLSMHTYYTVPEVLSS